MIVEFCEEDANLCTGDMFRLLSNSWLYEYTSRLSLLRALCVRSCV
ncbi:hypothetical protein M758_10G027700 [Ceratodon purpureus]|nr:hypothetical protein M758_10G027700 [Ceratodon purpureus]